MKTFNYLTTLFVVFYFSINVKAQTKKQSPTVFLNYNTTEELIDSQKSAAFQTDTIKPASFAMSCYTLSPSTALVLYYADVKVPHDSGYVTGTNIYGDLEKAQHFVNAITTTLTGCAVLLKRAFSSTSVTIGTKVKLYNYSAGAPTTTVIATSSLIPQNALNNSGFTVFTFSTPIVVTSDFVMSVVLPNHVGDTTAIFSTKTSCNSGTSNSWERAVDNSWGSIHTNWNFSASQNIDLAIFPLIKVNVVTAINTNYNTEAILYDAINKIVKTNNTDKPIRISVCDITGKIILTKVVNANEVLSLAELTNGFYILNVLDDTKIIFRKKIYL